MNFSRYSCKKVIFLFDSFGFSRLKEFIIQDDKDIINKIMYDLKKFNRVDKKITPISVKFSMREYKKITKKKFLNELPTIPIDLFHAINEFQKKTKSMTNIIIHLVDDQLLMTEKDTCCMY